jgi:hypothetical protein
MSTQTSLRKPNRVLLELRIGESDPAFGTNKRHIHGEQRCAASIHLSGIIFVLDIGKQRTVLSECGSSRGPVLSYHVVTERQ